MCKFAKLKLTNDIVNHVTNNGGSAEDCAVALAESNDKLVARIIELEGIAPRRIRLPDGRVMIYRCPDEFVS